MCSLFLAASGKPAGKRDALTPHAATRAYPRRHACPAKKSWGGQTHDSSRKATSHVPPRKPAGRLQSSILRGESGSPGSDGVRAGALTPVQDYALARSGAIAASYTLNPHASRVSFVGTP